MVLATYPLKLPRQDVLPEPWAYSIKKILRKKMFGQLNCFKTIRKFSPEEFKVFNEGKKFKWLKAGYYVVQPYFKNSAGRNFFGKPFAYFKIYKKEGKSFRRNLSREQALF